MQALVMAVTLLAPLARPGLSTSALYPRPSQAVIAGYSPRRLQRRVADLARRPLAARVAHWSRVFLGTPYGSAPVASKAEPEMGGPVAGQDLNLYRVDCETYVEQVMALALARRWDDVVPTLRRIRYDGGRPTPRRRHFTVVKGWLAGAERQGLLTDITRRIAPKATRVVEKSLAPTPGWRPYYLKRMRLLGPRALTGTAKITYIPLAKAMGLVKRIPPGTIVHVVSKPHPKSPYLVTHVGFAARNYSGPVFRHASVSPHRRKVEDRHFAAYLYYIGHTPSGPERRTGMGIHLSALRTPKQ
jgi:N-acetylmuramoyl-L-alanine amidase-like